MLFADAAEHLADEFLRLGPRDERTRVAFERQVEEGRVPDDVLQRFPHGAAFHRQAEFFKDALLQRMIEAQVQIQPLATERIRHQPFGLKSRIRHPVLRKVRGGALDDFEDGKHPPRIASVAPRVEAKLLPESAAR